MASTTPPRPANRRRNAGSAVSPPDVPPRVLSLVQLHGSNATALQTLEPRDAYFFHGDDARVAYLDTGTAWVAAGAPVAAEAHLAENAAAFERAARPAGKR